MAEPPALSDWTLVSLRPQGGHAALRRAAARRHAGVLAASPFKLAACDAAGELAAALSCPIRIASSPSAVRFAAAQARLDGHWLAIGHGTARALRKAGAASVTVADPQTADGLLRLPVLAAVAGRRIGLITAPDGRGLLERELPARGARLHIAAVYRRLPLALAPARRRRILALGARSAILVSSQRAFTQFWNQFEASEQDRLRRLLAVASSRRLLEYLHGLGFRRLALAGGTVPNDVLNALAEAIASERPSRSTR